MNWIIEQRWNHVLFMHWRINARELQSHLPYDLDLFEGDAVISIVPFRMNAIRFPFLPPVPFLSSLWELNLRTYVRVNKKPGVYFFTLDTDNRLGTLIANRFFNLPYRMASFSGEITSEHYLFSSERGPYRFSVNAELSHQPKKTSALDTWATERYFVFTHDDQNDFEGQVLHEPWKLEAVSQFSFQDQFAAQVNLDLNHTPDEVSYCRELKVRFKPFLKI